MGEEACYQVFVSYTTVDRAIAEAICSALELRGLRCWVAPRDIAPSRFWADQIVRAIDVCPVLVVVFSDQTNRSPHVPRELTLAVSRNRSLVPYRVNAARPEGAFEYLLCMTHWLDAAQPLDPRKISELCDAVVLALRSPKPNGKAAGEVVPLDVQRHPVLRRVAEEMLNQGQATLNLAAFTSEERKAIDRLVALGLLRNEPSWLQPDERFVSAGNADACQLLLRAWIESDPNRNVAELLRASERFPPLGDAIAGFLAAQPVEMTKTLLASCIAEPSPAVERFVSALGKASLSSQETQRCLLHQVVHSGKLSALRGVARWAQDEMASGRLDHAHELLSGILQRWTVDAADHPTRVFLIETANELGRIERRQGRLCEAEKRFRQALHDAREMGEPTLAGIITNNLARTLLDNPTEPRRREAIALLESNIACLLLPEQRRHLAVAFNNLAGALSAEAPEKAEEHLREDVRLCRELKDDLALADALDSLGVHLIRQQRPKDAQQVQREEVSLCGKFFDLHRHARALANLGAACIGEYEESEDPKILERALDVLTKSAELWSSQDEPRLFAPTLENLGQVQYRLSLEAEAKKSLAAAVEQYKRWPEGEEIALEIQGVIRKLFE